MFNVSANDALTWECGVAVHQDRERGSRIVLYRLSAIHLTRFLRCAGPAYDHGVHIFEVARIGRERDGHHLTGAVLASSSSSAPR